MITKALRFLRAPSALELLRHAFLFAAIALGLATAACSSFETATTAVFDNDERTPAQVVFAAKADYTALLAVAVQYESQPRCSETQAQPCSETGVVEILRQADRTADAALDSAEAAVRLASDEELQQGAVEIALDALKQWRAVLADFGIWKGEP